jgi:hypothetical protein
VNRCNSKRTSHNLIADNDNGNVMSHNRIADNDNGNVMGHNRIADVHNPNVMGCNAIAGRTMKMEWVAIELWRATIEMGAIATQT